MADMNRQFTQEIQMVNIHMKNKVNLSSNREIEIVARL